MPTIEERGYIHCSIHNIYFLTTGNLCPMCHNSKVEEVTNASAEEIKRHKSNIRRKNKELKELRTEVEKYRDDVKADTEEEEGEI